MSKTSKVQSFLKNIISPIEHFLNLQASSGYMLFGAAVIALILANSPFWIFYDSLLHQNLSLNIGLFKLEMTLHHFVNDVLMVIFFFVVGLEIKRELIQGSLSSRKKASLPFIAALGGMVVPAGIYILFNFSSESIIGWGIPMATDIAFSLGVLAFVSKRVPLSLKIFLLALCTIDDLGAVLVIASVYSSNISGLWLSLSGLLIFIIFCFKQIRVSQYWPYVILGIGLWFCIYQSGIHATMAGVILGLITPVKPLVRGSGINKEIFEAAFKTDSFESGMIEKIEKELKGLRSPTQFLIDRLHKFVSFVVMPIFAFFNSGLRFDENFSFSEFFSSPVSQGIFLGLLVGKPLGIFLFSYLALKFKWAHLPEEVRLVHIFGVGLIAGIGFTMALFISSLSLQSFPILENYSKASIFLASILAGVLGFGVLFLFGKMNRKI